MGASRRALRPLSNLAKSHRLPGLLQHKPRAQQLHTSRGSSFAYPREGVFQQGSPPRESRSFAPPPPPGTPPPPPPASRSRWIPKWYNVLASILVAGSGYYMISSGMMHLDFVSPEPGSPEDIEELQALSEELDEIPLVQQLRDAWRLDEEGRRVPVWREWTAYEGLSRIDSRRHTRLTTGPLRGSAGVQAQKVFWNDQEKQLCLFINFGSGTSGWPGVVHGGAIATICDEGLGRVAIRTSEQKTAVTATLQIEYLDKVEPGGWYVLIASLDKEQSTNRKFFVEGFLACVGDAGPTKDGPNVSNIHPHAVAKGLFVVPKGVELKAIEEDF